MQEKQEKFGRASKYAKRCACGYEATEFAFGLAAIGDKIEEVRFHESYKISKNLIEFHKEVASQVLDHLHRIKEFCNIDVIDEQNRLKKLQSDLNYINDPKKWNKLSDDTTFIADNIRRKLYECAREK